MCFPLKGLSLIPAFFYILNCGSKTVKAADGSSFHLPVKGTIMSLENSEGSLSKRKKSDPDMFRSMWGSSVIDGSLSAFITEQGVINDAKDIMVLKTSVSFCVSVLCFSSSFKRWGSKGLHLHISTV